MTIMQFLSAYKELGYGGILVVFCFFVGRYLLRQNRECYESYQSHVTNHKNEIKELTHNILKVVEENTESNTALTKTIEHLDRRLEGCPFNTASAQKHINNGER